MTQPPKALPYPGKTIFLMRHGETQSDGVKRYIGRTDLPLSTIGKSQAKSWQAFFKEIPLTAIVSSNLSRARDTAAIIAGRRDIPRVAKTGFRVLRFNQSLGT